MKWRMRWLMDLEGGIAHSAVMPLKLSWIRVSGMKTFQCPLSLLLSDVLPLSVFLSISSDGTIFLGVLQSFFSGFYVSFHLISLIYPGTIATYQLFPFYLTIFSFCLPTHIYTFFPPSIFSVIFCPCLPRHLSSFHFFPLINTIMLSLMCASPHVCP